MKKAQGKELTYNKREQLKINSFLIDPLVNTAQKMKFSINDSFSKCDQTCSFLWIWSHLPKKSLMGNFISCALQLLQSKTKNYCNSLPCEFPSWNPPLEIFGITEKYHWRTKELNTASTYRKFSEELKFLIPWYAHVRLCSMK